MASFNFYGEKHPVNWYIEGFSESFIVLI
jgi:hypothetical protein